MYQNILYEHVEINHLIIKVVVFGIAPVLFNLNSFQTQPRALNPSYAGIPVFRPKQDSLSSLRLSRVESSTSRKGSPSPAWSSAAVVKAYSSPLLQPQDQLGLQQPSMRTRRGDETSIRSSEPDTATTTLEGSKSCSYKTSISSITESAIKPSIQDDEFIFRSSARDGTIGQHADALQDTT